MVSTRWNQESLKHRISMVESLKLIQDVYRKKPDPFMYFVQIVMDAKSDELINIFSGAFPEEKSRVVQILTEIDPANKAKYEKINCCQYTIKSCYARKTVRSELCPYKRTGR